MKKIFGILTVLSIVALTIVACDADVEIDQTVEQIKAQQPTITGFSPGTAAVNTLVNIDGTFLNFATEAYIGNVRATITSRITGQRLQIQVPNNAVSGNIRVVTEQGKEAISADVLTVTYPVPAVTAALPNEANVNALVNIIGTNLTSVTGVNFGGVAGTIEFQESQALVVRVPNNPGFVSVDLTYLTTSGAASLNAATNFEVVLPQPTIGGFPAITSRDKEVIISGQDMNLITAGDVDGNAVTFTSQTPNEVRFMMPAAIQTGYVTINLDFQGGGLITRSNIPYINGQLETFFEFDNDPASVFVLSTNVDPGATQILSTTNPPPFPGNSHYELTMTTATGSTIGRSRIQTVTSNPAYVNILTPGNYSGTPVMHFWLNTENTQPVMVVYFGGTSNAFRRRWQNATTNTGSNWQLCAIRLNGFIPNQTTSDVFEIRTTTGSTTPTLPTKFNFDWLIVTDRVLTEFGAVDVTDEFSPAG
ncbi:MAG: IPT/TIG domain-containing protein [Nonlabens sp.]|nr:IPT/TIG domain-containing protein [Nonlabens sp.]